MRIRLATRTRSVGVGLFAVALLAGVPASAQAGTLPVGGDGAGQATAAAPDRTANQLDGVAAPQANPVTTDFTWQGQINGYYCGPGATRIALSAKMDPPGQEELGAALGTDSNGTDDISLVAPVLNDYLGEDHYDYRYIPDPAGSDHAAQLKKDVVANVDEGYALVANVVSGWRPPGYPSGTIYHYVSIVGYEDGGDQVLVADPAAEGSAGSRWENVPRTYLVSVSDMATWIGSKGYAY